MLTHDAVSIMADPLSPSWSISDLRSVFLSVATMHKEQGDTSSAIRLLEEGLDIQRERVIEPGTEESFFNLLPPPLPGQIIPPRGAADQGPDVTGGSA